MLSENLAHLMLSDLGPHHGADRAVAAGGALALGPGEHVPEAQGLVPCAARPTLSTRQSPREPSQRQRDTERRAHRQTDMLKTLPVLDDAH